MSSPKKFDPNQFQLKYLIIPIGIVTDTDIPPSAKVLFGLISALEHPIDGCKHSNKSFSSVLKTGPQTITNHINLLKQFGYISIENGSNKNRIIRMASKTKDFMEQ